MGSFAIIITVCGAATLTKGVLKVIEVLDR